jgi:hypothetical protein
MKFIQLTKFNDPGHGWLRVPVTLLNKSLDYGFKPTEYSYSGKKYVYLEEDCDATGFLNIMAAHGYTFAVHYKHTSKPSHIRQKDRLV